MKDMMMGQMMSMFSSMLPKPEEPDNEVAEFVSGMITKMYPEPNELVETIRGVVVGMANADPQGTLNVLVTQYNDIGEFVRGMEVADGATSPEY